MLMLQLPLVIILIYNREEVFSVLYVKQIIITLITVKLLKKADRLFRLKIENRVIKRAN